MEVRNYLISENNGADNHAGSKARNDIEAFLKDDVHEILKVTRFFNSKGLLSKFKIVYEMSIEWINIVKSVNTGSNILIQYPLESPKEIVNIFIKVLKKVKDVRTIAIIHDLESLRFDTKRKKREIEYLQEFNKIIVHNEKMKKYLVENGVGEEKNIVLEIFDYKVEEACIIDRNLGNEIAIAGNLAEKKSGYIYKLNDIKMNVKFNLFGPNYSGSSNAYVEYFGQFPPEVLPRSLKGNFGLVWDGNDINECSGTTGKYLMYNNPHKLSLYIVSKLPIIIWSKAAMAEFVKNENIGIVVDEIEDIPVKISNINEEDYKEMLNNINKISAKIEKGYYIKNSISKLT